MKGVVSFGIKGKWSPRYVGPNEILQKVGKVAYVLKVSNELASVQSVFHVSVLKKCIGNPESILPIESFGVKDNLSSGEILCQILDRKVKRLRNKEVVSVQVL
ncbi:uncharacterized protein [Solanum lycopersicum]|uniref:uncharacterized protein n=1 Tax=Solanum lycopersicum TaxID=4081 RepID=UPI003748E36D